MQVAASVHSHPSHDGTAKKGLQIRPPKILDFEREDVFFRPYRVAVAVEVYSSNTVNYQLLGFWGSSGARNCFLKSKSFIHSYIAKTEMKVMVKVMIVEDAISCDFSPVAVFNTDRPNEMAKKLREFSRSFWPSSFVHSLTR